MDSILSFSTNPFTLFSTLKVHSRLTHNFRTRRFTSFCSRNNPSFISFGSSFGDFSLAMPLAHRRLQCLSHSATSRSDEADDTFHGFSKNTPHSDWDSQVFASLAPNDFELESLTKEVEAWKVKVRNLLLDSTQDLYKNILVINLLCHLGISYHFEDEISLQLDDISTKIPKLLEDNDYDLFTIANLFRILRQYGYNITCDVFKKFKNGEGEFKEEIANDIEGLLSLYEACFLAFHGEDMLDLALDFARKRLELLAENSSSSLQNSIKYTLMFPFHHNLERFSVAHYILQYEQDESANQTLLRFAKLDFNRHQLLYRKELALLSKWWKDTSIAQKFPYTRDRLVESHLWSVGCVSEPQYSLARMIYTKYIVLFTVMDDTYDSYGTIEELQLLTTALERWTADAGDDLPDHMKHFYKIVFEDLETNATKGCLFEGMKNDAHINECSCKTIYLKETIKELARSYLQEAKWKKEGKAPDFGEYMKHANVTGGPEVFASIFLLGAEDMITKEILWVRSDPKMLRASKLICRLLNDLAGRKDEKQRQDFPKAVDCFMEKYRMSESEAIGAIRKIVENEWKTINEELAEQTHIPRMLLKHTLSYTRMAVFLDGNIDMFTYPAHLKELIASIFISPLPL